MWPGSPANPCAPRRTDPSIATPPPIPVPSVTRTTSSTPRATPTVISAKSAHVASLSITTEQQRSSTSNVRTGTSIMHCRFGADRSTSPSATRPASPTPRWPSSSISRARSLTASTTAFAVEGVGRDWIARTSEGRERSIATASIFVPPTSIPTSRSLTGE